jgi:hypothetical protein
MVNVMAPLSYAIKHAKKEKAGPPSANAPTQATSLVGQRGFLAYATLQPTPSVTPPTPLRLGKALEMPLRSSRSGSGSGSGSGKKKKKEDQVLKERWQLDGFLNSIFSHTGYVCVQTERERTGFEKVCVCV